MHLAPLICFTLGAFAAVMGYLQQTKSAASAILGGKKVKGEIPASSDSNLNQIRAMADGIVGRLSAQTSTLGFRANLNLCVGAFICLLGFFILAYYVFIEGKPTDHFQMGMQFAIRLSLVLFVEVFAYFFLSLYRAGLFDIKYFQNELTNAAFRLAAIEVAFAKGDMSVIKKVSEELLRTERNFILKKNESTHDLRQAEMLLENEKSAVGTLERVLSSTLNSLAARGKGNKVVVGSS